MRLSSGMQAASAFSSVVFPVPVPPEIKTLRWLLIECTSIRAVADEPDAIQRAKAGRCEGSTGMIEPHVCANCAAASRVKEPPELVQDDRAKRARQLFVERALV